MKRQAEEEAVVILQHWRQKVRRLRLYRACLCAALILAGMGLFGYSYYLVDSSIPSVIYMRAESEESLALDIPAKGEILSVSEQGNQLIFPRCRDTGSESAGDYEDRNDGQP